MGTRAAMKKATMLLAGRECDAGARALQTLPHALLPGQGRVKNGRRGRKHTAADIYCPVLSTKLLILTTTLTTQTL